ncbi:GatB/YqeY domain-containing protein [Arthrobacter cavernae]|uniref:GatB/YqeY domain-containing protein n=1 Tax=Arthrobacter cavernae TaxID=2817681 RepID=A0A939HDU8_9MICC|nr:GatB/YqeY domain-containing protein [Arthrobacter cavernae]MBO1268026.1 GatB/YqeY domain-containing protein [Arthrobacter cavernae]
MSNLKERLHADVVSHIKDGNRVALSTVRNVLSEIDTREKAGKAPIHLDDAQITAMLQKEAAHRHETAHIYEEAGKTERAAAEIAEAEVIEAYLPEPLTAAEVESIVDEAIASLKADGVELSLIHMGYVMKPVTEKVAGRFDGKAVSEIVRARLS